MKKKEMAKRIRSLEEQLQQERQRHGERKEGSIPASICLNEQMIEKYYDELILGTRKPRSGVEILIQKRTRIDAGTVLVCLGLNHPASPTVLRYLADQKYAVGMDQTCIFRRWIREVSHQEKEQPHIQEWIPRG